MGAPGGTAADLRGIVQIAHGLGEHIGRYYGLIEVLVGAGLVVYGNDHRGHGRTALSSKRLADFGEGGFRLLVEDMVRLSEIAKEEIPAKPLILLGHSMGSFAAQLYAFDHSYLLDGLALSGSGALDGVVRLAKSTISTRRDDTKCSMRSTVVKSRRIYFSGFLPSPTMRCLTLLAKESRTQLRFG